jgi:hypothetical protein
MEIKLAKTSKSSQPDRPKYAWIFEPGLQVVGEGWKKSWDWEFERAHLDSRQAERGVRLPHISVPLEMSNKKTNSFPHMFCLFGLLYVSIEFREIVEKYEPDVHNFIPLDLSSRLETRQYFILNYTQQIKAEIFDLSSLTSMYRSDGERIYGSPNKNDMLTVDGNVVNNKHLWGGHWTMHYYTSDQVYSEFVKLKRRNCDALRVKIVY